MQLGRGACFLPLILNQKRVETYTPSAVCPWFEIALTAVTVKNETLPIFIAD
ncbi:hypothetical protein NC99_42510 [Sunxiuqinia dokdonensis]|uniref:Uncharacterized protein n=1 Tax=Sunxiuqinia dokdonensis TaxID=1409788 RepID=A0A0L8V3F7_9BACT|nr:hypothetical protein NC99_42510 [Sunxiuqinia dokdonensis]